MDSGRLRSVLLNPRAGWVAAGAANQIALPMINTKLMIVTSLLTFSPQIHGMFFPANFNLEELESNRRRHIMLASNATAASVMQMHLSLAALYQNQAAAFSRSVPRANRNISGGLELVICEGKRIGR